MIYKNHHFTTEELKGQNFDQEVFSHCSFSQVNLKFSHFTHCQFVTCDFSGVLFESTAFHWCEFPESKLSFLDFAPVEFKECDFSTTILEECIFQRLKDGSNYERKALNLQHSNFQKAILNRAAFVWCDLTKVEFAEAELSQAVFEKCTLVSTDFRGCNLEGANFESCRVAQSILDVRGFIQLGQGKGFVLAE